MQLDRVAIVLRPRQGWEAVDLGFRMAAHWARPLWAVCITVVWPLALALSIALASSPWLAALLIWWLKPLYDRFLLHVLSRAVFGAVPTLPQTLGAWREILQPGLPHSLLTRFVDFARAFTLPVLQLERQTGKAARARRKLLKQRAGAHASGLTLICLHLEAIVALGLIAAASLLVPDAQMSADSAEAWQVDQWWQWSDTLVYVLALTLMEPFYVAAGFALYLNRRVTLEGWDVELALRRMAQRLQGGAAALMLILGLGLGACVSAPSAWADAAGKTVIQADTDAEAASDEDDDREAPAYVPRDSERRQAIVRVLSQPVYGSEREVQRWRSIEEDDPEQPVEVRPRSGWLDLMDALAEVLRVLAWLGLAVLVIAIALAVARRLPGRQPPAPAQAPPRVLFGLSIAPDSLPADIPEAARAALAAGDTREALSLLYRGALSHLVHQRGLRVGQGATEGDVLRLAQRHWADGPSTFFQALMPAWVAAAYAARLPEASEVAALCDAYAAALLVPAASAESP